MRLIGIIASAVILISAHLSASAGFNGFPLLQEHPDWLFVQDAHQPVRQLFSAIQERAVAANVDPIVFVETVKADGEWVDDADNARDYFIFLGNEWTSTDAPPLTPDSVNYYRGTLPDREWWVSDEPYNGQWVLPLVDSVDAGGLLGTITVAGEALRFTDVVLITITNQIGPFDLTINGTNYVGQTFVTRDLLNSMWGKLDELSEKFYLPYTSWTNGSWADWDTWFDSDSSIDTELPSNFLWRQATYSFTNNLYRTHPVVRRFDYAPVWNAAGLTNAVTSLESDDYGVIIAGTSRKYPLVGEGFSSRITMADAWYGTTGLIYQVEGNQTNLVPVSGWIINRIGGNEGADYDFYLSDEEPTLAFLQAPAGVSATVTGEAWFRDYYESETTNWVWSGVWSDQSVLDTVVYTNLTYTNYMASVQETLTAGAYSTNVWSFVNGFDVSGGTTNDYARLVWDIDRWLPMHYRLYAEELDRMYYALASMRWTIPVKAYGGEIVSWPENAVIDTTNSLLRESAGDIHPWLTNRFSSIESERGTNFYGTPVNWWNYKSPTSFTAWGEYDSGATAGVFYEMVDGEPVRLETDPESAFHWGWPGLVPSHWGQTVTWATNLFMYWPDPETEEYWKVPVDIEVTDRPPSKASVVEWVDYMNEMSFLSSTNTVNSNSLPFALHMRAVDARLRFTSGGTLIPSYATTVGARLNDNLDFIGFAYRGRAVNSPREAPDGYGIGPPGMSRTFRAHVSSADLVFDYELPPGAPPVEARVFMGDYSETVYTEKNLSVITNHPDQAVWEDFSGFTVGEGATYSWGPLESFPPVFFDWEMPSFLPQPVWWLGNGVLDSQRYLEVIDKSASNSVIRVELLGANTFPESPGDPSDPTTIEFDPFVDQRWGGYKTTELFLILQWDFEYR